MSDQQDSGSWNPYDLLTEEHRSILETSIRIDQAQCRIRTLALSLAGDGPLSQQETQWLINLAYNALWQLSTIVEYEEFIACKRQEQSQRTDELLNAPAELPPYEPVPIPEWLAGLQHQEGG